ncbi:MAG: hypothetical protein FWD71_01535 [Oscillospiraceae bacterium]|nr:hypothetical protein [Oscillospiraceae bacterium]
MKKMNFKKFAALFLIIGFCISMIFSCSSSNNNQTQNQNNNAGADGSQNNPEQSAGVSAGTTMPPHDMPQKDYNGYNFNFLDRNYDGNGYWGEYDISAESENGDPINDAVFKRNSIIEDRYNIKIAEKQSSNVSGDAKKVILAGTHEYDVIMPGLNDIAPLATQGYLLDAKSQLPYLQLDMPWWDQRANQMLTMGNRLYFLIGDMTLQVNDATWVIMFNKKVAEQYDMGDLYSYVKDDNWNFNTYFGLIKQVSKDLNGDGKIGFDDQVGLLTDNGAKTIMVYNTGVMVAKKDANDLPYLALNDEKTITAAQQVFDVLKDKTVCINANTDLSSIKDPWTDGVNKMFQEDRGLFYMLSLTVMNKMRGMESDFGVLPFPKLDSTQTEYYHTVQASTAACMVLPNTTPDPEMASIILEDMNYESTNTVRHAYYDITITNKTIRDEESAQMLDLIFSTRMYDLGFIFNWGNIGYLLESVYPDAGTFTSKYEKAAPAAQAALDKTITAVNSIS